MIGTNRGVMSSLSKSDIEKAFMPKDECSICEGDYDPDCGGIQGYFGICPVTFCEWCYSSIESMVCHNLGIDDDYFENKEE